MENQEVQECFYRLEKMFHLFQATGDDMVVEISYGDLTYRCLIQENGVDTASRIDIRTSIPRDFDVDFLSDVTLFGLPEFDPIYLGSPVKVTG